MPNMKASCPPALAARLFRPAIVEAKLMTAKRGQRLGIRCHARRRVEHHRRKDLGDGSNHSRSTLRKPIRAPDLVGYRTVAPTPIGFARSRVSWTYVSAASRTGKYPPERGANQQRAPQRDALR